MDTEQLKKEFALLPTLPSEYEPHSWDQHRHSIRRHVINDDPTLLTQWSTIQATMYVGDCALLRGELPVILQNNRYCQAAIDCGFGGASHLPDYPLMGTNFVHQLYHLSHLERLAKIEVRAFRRIVEFGGGYGAMCAVVKRLGFHGEYYIYDLPEFSLVQRYYLSNTERDKSVTFNASENGGFPVPPKNTDILIACYSISEAPPVLRDKFFDAVSPNYVLIAHQEIYQGRNNRSSLDVFMDRRPQYEWRIAENQFIGGHRYIVGVKNAS